MKVLMLSFLLIMGVSCASHHKICGSDKSCKMKKEKCKDDMSCCKSGSCEMKKKKKAEDKKKSE